MAQVWRRIAGGCRTIGLLLTTSSGGRFGFVATLLGCFGQNLFDKIPKCLPVTFRSQQGAILDL
jgi:hypothetical protein